MGFIDTVKKAAALDKVNADAVNNDRQALNEALKDREIMKKHLELLIEQKNIIEKEIDITKKRIV